MRLGIIVLSEIAQRALSPAVNDPGMAISIIDRITVHLVGDGRPEVPEPPTCPRWAQTLPHARGNFVISN